MAWFPTVIRRAAIVLFVGSIPVASLSAQSAATLTRIALFEPAGHSSEPTLAAVLHTVADSVELSLVVLQRYDVRRLPSADPDTDLPRVRSYCDANHIDQAILGSGSQRPEGGFAFRLLVYDRKSDSVTIDKQGRSSGALDMFDATDALVASLLDGLSGAHLLFGSLSVDTDPPGATVAVNGRDAGVGPLSLRGLPVGAVQISARQPGHEDGAATVTIADGETASASLKLVRSTGRLSVQMPSDAQLTVSSVEIGQKQLSGSGTMELPTGEYQLAAASTGLANATGRITVSRNATVSWLPWSRGYLAVSAAPAGALITVDGVAKGAAPQVVEVEPGVLHRLQVSRDTYFTYVADLSSAAGTKTVIAPELVSQPGSISVSTSIPGARVRVDTSDWQDTPFVFEDVPAGVHTVEILSVRNGDGAFTAGPPFQVTVSPAQRLDVVKEMVRGQTHLTIRDAPPGSVVQITGLTVDSEQALTGGVDVPSGVIHLTITSPASQKWYGDTYLEPGKRSFTSIYDLTWQVPQRTISLDKGAEQWSGLVKAWNKGFATQFVTGQPGSQVSGGYLSMDDHSLYVRFEFEDGTPTPKLVRQIKDVLSYGVLIYTNHNKVDRVTVGIRFHGNGSTSTNFGVYNPNAQWTQLGGQISYRAGPGSLQVAIPLSSIKEYVKGLSLVTLQIDQENDAGYWGPWRETASCRVTFGF